jgi:hypothetical protein
VSLDTHKEKGADMLFHAPYMQGESVAENAQFLLRQYLYRVVGQSKKSRGD